MRSSLYQKPVRTESDTHKIRLTVLVVLVFLLTIVLIGRMFWLQIAKPKILVTGAAGGKQGATGRVLTHLLLDRGVHVRALVRSDDDRADQLRAAGAEVRRHD